MNEKKRPSVVAEIFKKSLIVSALIRFSDFISEQFSESFFGYLLCGNYRRESGSITELISERLRLKQRISIPFKRFMAKAFEKSFILGKLNRLLHQIPDLQIKAVGAFTFSFGLYISISYLIRRFAMNLPEAVFSELYLGIVCVAIGGAMSSSSKKISSAICESKILSFLLFSVLGIKKEAFRGSHRIYGRNDAAFLLGIAIGALSAFVSPFIIVCGLFLLILAYAILTVPECGVICIILALPFLRTTYIAILCAYVTACWLLKLMRGKRTLATNSLDISVLAFMTVIFFGGVISVTPAESMRTALLYICLMSGYFLAVNLIRTSEWFYRCVKALIFSLAVTTSIGVIEYALGLSPFKWLDTSLFSYIPGRAVSLFGNPNVLAEFIILTLPFLLVFRAASGKGDAAFGLSLLSVTAILCLIFTWSRGGWLAAIAGGIILLMLYSKKNVGFLIASLVIIPAVPAFLPSSVSERFLSSFSISDSSISYRTGIWNGVDRLLSECFAGGIGIGESAFRRIYPLFSLSTIEEAPHTHNLYTQIMVSVGITGLAVFIAVMLIFLRHFASYYSSGKYDEKRLRLSSAAGFTGICAILIHGFTDYVWYNNRIFLLFWLILGLTSAAIRTGVRERVYREPEGISLDLDIKKLSRPKI